MIAAWAAGRGMKVNQKKTAILCMSDAISFTPKVCMRIEDGEVRSGDTLKLLGFTFTRSPTVNHHVEEIVRKLRSRLWPLS